MFDESSDGTGDRVLRPRVAGVGGRRGTQLFEAGQRDRPILRGEGLDSADTPGGLDDHELGVGPVVLAARTGRPLGGPYREECTARTMHGAKDVGRRREADVIRRTEAGDEEIGVSRVAEADRSVVDVLEAGGQEILEHVELFSPRGLGRRVGDGEHLGVGCAFAREVPRVELGERVGEVFVVEEDGAMGQARGVELGHDKEHVFETAEILSQPAEREPRTPHSDRLHMRGVHAERNSGAETCHDRVAADHVGADDSPSVEDHGIVREAGTDLLNAVRHDEFPERCQRCHREVVREGSAGLGAYRSSGADRWCLGCADGVGRGRGRGLRFGRRDVVG